MHKRPSKLELYTCCTIMWAAILCAAFLIVVRIAGSPGDTNSYDGALIVVFAALAWRKDIELRQLRWAVQQAFIDFEAKWTEASA